MYLAAQVLGVSEMLDLDSRVTIPEAVLFHELAGEAILLHQGTGKYYGLNEVGTRMWMLVAEHGALRPAYAQLLAEYDVNEEQLRRDFLTLIDDLTYHGLVESDEA